MKNISALFSFFMFILLAVNAQAQNQEETLEGPIMTFDNMVVDYGKIGYLMLNLDLVQVE